MSEVCQFLEWDSEFFGYRIGRVDANLRQLTPDSMAQINAWCADQRIDCLYFLADVAHHETLWLASQNGFIYTDTRVMWEVKLTEAPEPWQSIRLAVPSDLPILKAIARTSYRDSRFYFDPIFPLERCDKMFETWIEKSVSGALADAVLVLTDDDQLVGYSAVEVTEHGGKWNLFGINTEVRGKGLGTTLLRATLRWFWERDLHTVYLATQGRNLGAQRLYVKHGFLPTSMSNWYHRWSPEILASQSKQIK